MKGKIGCDQVIKIMRDVVVSIKEPVSESIGNCSASEHCGKMTKVTMLWDEADFILDQLDFLNNCIIALEKRIDHLKDEA